MDVSSVSPVAKRVVAEVFDSVLLVAHMTDQKFRLAGVLMVL